ncbi:MAG TPA: HGGxSTG domain-containing protein [Plasticicumulans sp.]|nr:HGGxSTG domain-containing protein [Plasticicumulans sp.]
MQRERRLRPARIRAGLAVLEGWRKRKVNRPRCGARCRDGHACRAPVVLRVDGTLAKRCRMHGGLSTGARSPAGQARALAALQAGNARWRARRKEFPDTNAHAHALVVDFDDA